MWSVDSLEESPVQPFETRCASLCIAVLSCGLSVVTSSNLLHRSWEPLDVNDYAGLIY